MQNDTINNKQPEGNMLGQLWFRYFPYWPVFIVFLLLSMAGAWFYLRYKVPIYQAGATILIKDEKKGMDDSKMLESLNLLYTKKIIENETEILKSRSLMNEVVKQLHLYAAVSKDGLPVKEIAGFTPPLIIEAKYPDSLKGSGKVFFTFDRQQGLVKTATAQFPVNEWVNTPYGVLRFTPANNTVTGDKLYFFLANPEDISGDLLARLSVSPVSKLSTVISLKISDPSPSRARTILNKLIEQYNKASINDKNSLAINTLAFVEDRLNHVAYELDSIEKKVQRFKTSRGAIDISTQGKLFLQNVSENDQKLGAINMQMAVLDQVEQYVQSKKGGGGLAPSTLGINDPLLSQMLEKLNALELDYEKKVRTTGENNYSVVSISDQINKIKPGILENIHNQRNGLEASRKNLSVTNNAYASTLQSFPQKEKELLEISRDQNTKNNIYSFLLQKREEASLSHSSTVADSRIIDKAVAGTAPISPNKKVIYMAALVFALAISIGLLAANELINQKILYRNEIEKYTSIPIIGEIVYEKSDSALIISGQKRSFAAEQFRKIRAALLQMGLSPKASRKKILVTSTISGEGKSFVSANLALSLAISGKKVVLVELDLVNPTLAEKLNYESVDQPGVADYLEGEIDQEHIIKRVEANENLFFMPAGTLPLNPSELIMSDRLPQLLHYLDDIFDYVIIDTSPAGPSSDPYILSHMCDATLYIIRHKYTPKLVVQRMDEDNKTVNLKNPAIIFNGIRSRGFTKNNYGYGYGYGYGHYYEERKDLPRRKKKSADLVKA